MRCYSHLSDDEREQMDIAGRRADQPRNGFTESPTCGRSQMPVEVVARGFLGRGVGTIRSARKFSASWARLNCPAR